MKKGYKILIILFVIVFFTSLFFTNKDVRQSKNTEVNSIQKNFSGDSLGFKNIILIGWDGARRKHVENLLQNDELPNLKELIGEKAISTISINTISNSTKPGWGKMSTKTGWSEILTGYGPEITGVYSNFDYKPIPKGYTIFERLEEYFGSDNIVTMLIAGKDHGVGARGPHGMCMNCLPTFNTYLQGEKLLDSIDREPIFVKREGEPYYYAKNILDVYSVGLGKNWVAGQEAIEQLRSYKEKRFFAFIHLRDADEAGHIYGQDSQEYINGIVSNDDWLGAITFSLKELGIYDKTLIYVTSGPGFDEREMSPSDAPYTFLATNNKKVTKNGDRKDITPTILENYGFGIKSISPPLEGVSLIGAE